MLRAIVRILRSLSVRRLQARERVLSPWNAAVRSVGRQSLCLLLIHLMALASTAVAAQDSIEMPATAATVEISLLDYDFWPAEKDESWAEICPEAVRQPLRAMVDAAQAKPHPSLQQLKAMCEAARGAAPESPLPDFAYALACEQAGYPTECNKAYPSLVAKGKAFFLPGWQAALMWELEHGRERDVAVQLPEGVAAAVSEHRDGQLSTSQFSQAMEWFGAIAAFLLDVRKLDKKRRQTLDLFAGETQSHALAGAAFTKGMERMRTGIEATRAKGLVSVNKTDEKKLASLERTLTSLEEKGMRLTEEKSKSESERESLRQQVADQIGEVDEVLKNLQAEFLQLASLYQSLERFYRYVGSVIEKNGKMILDENPRNVPGQYKSLSELKTYLLFLKDPLGRPVRAARFPIRNVDGELLGTKLSISVLEGPPGQEVVSSTIEGEIRQLEQSMGKLRQTGLAVHQRRQTMINLYQREMGVRVGQELKTAQFQEYNEKRTAATQEKLEKTVKASRDKLLASADTYFSWNAAEELAQLLERVKE